MIKTFRQIKKEGKEAWHKDMLPTQCPYLRAFGNHSDKIEAWLEGWETENTKHSR